MDTMKDMEESLTINQDIFQYKIKDLEGELKRVRKLEFQGKIGIPEDQSRGKNNGVDGVKEEENELWKITKGKSYMINLELMLIPSDHTVC